MEEVLVKMQALTTTAMGGMTLVLLGASAYAQTQAGSGAAETSALPPTADQQQQEQDVSFVVLGGALYQFSSDIDSGGDMSVTRFNAGLGAMTKLTDTLELSLRLNYFLDLYDFGGDPLGLPTGTEPWDDIHTANAGVLFSWDLNNEFTMFGGPVVQLSREAGADWDDGFTAGGLIGASYEFTPQLTLGAALLITSQIEDDVRVSPVPLVHWNINEQWAITTQASARGSGIRGTELVYNAGKGWEFALGGSYEFSRFRLD